jgi:hypothetical protein
LVCNQRNLQPNIIFFFFQIAIISRRSESFRFHVENGVAKSVEAPFPRSDGNKETLREIAIPSDQFLTLQNKVLNREEAFPEAGFV